MQDREMRSVIHRGKGQHWYKLILRMYQLDAGVRETFFRNFIVNASLREAQRRKRYQKRMTAMYRGQSFLILPAHVTFTAQDAGQQSMATN